MNTNHYSDLYEEDFIYKCQSCGASESISNTSRYGWTCDDCVSEFERVDAQLEDHEARKRRSIQERQEY